MYPCTFTSPFISPGYQYASYPSPNTPSLNTINQSINSGYRNSAHTHCSVEDVHPLFCLVVFSTFYTLSLTFVLYYNTITLHSTACLEREIKIKISVVSFREFGAPLQFLRKNLLQGLLPAGHLGSGPWRPSRRIQQLLLRSKHRIQ